MSRFVAHSSAGLLPARRRLGDELERALQHVEAHGAVDRRRDQLAPSRVEEASVRGLIAVGQISSVEAALGDVSPHARGRLRAVADAGTIGIVGVVAQSGF